MRIEVDSRIEPLFAALASDLLSQRELNIIAVQEGERLTRDHLAVLAGTRHRPVSRFNFWEEAARSVSASELGNSAEIRIDQVGVAQRYYGGTINPVNAKFLAIPIEGTEAEGRVTKDFDDLVPIISPLTAKGVLAKDGVPLFTLIKSVTQDPDPSVLPEDEEYVSAITAKARESVAFKVKELTK